MTVEEAEKSIERITESSKNALIEMIVAIKNNLNALEGKALISSSSVVTPLVKPKYITFRVTKPFYFREKKVTKSLEVNLNSLTSLEEERLTKLIQKGYLRRVKNDNSKTL